MNWQAKSSRAFNFPTSWQQLQKGDEYVDLLSQHFCQWSTKILGQQLVRIGGLSAELQCKMALPYHFVLSPKIDENLTAVSEQLASSLIQSDLAELPFETQSVDVCIAINSLNFMQDPHQFLREIQRVLTDDGYLFLSIFNPFSPLLCKQDLAKDPHKKMNFRHFLPFRIVDWLELLNFEILQQQALGNGIFSPLIAIVAQKRTYPLSLQPKKVRFNPAEIFNNDPVGAFVESKKIRSN
ncbi:hypothetical protein A4G18_01060 [Pasteurellaceae bacterium Pebbles2]|nr:hypothetical protein [Pasteurellaceae bacterium Pebbles2]